MANVNDGTEGGADPGGMPGGGPDVRTGTYDGDGDRDTEYAGSTSPGGDLKTGMVSDGIEGGADNAGSTGGQPRPEDFL